MRSVETSASLLFTSLGMGVCSDVTLHKNTTAELPTTPALNADINTQGFACWCCGLSHNK